MGAVLCHARLGTGDQDVAGQIMRLEVAGPATIAAARGRGERPARQPLNSDKVQAAPKPVEAVPSPTRTASQPGLRRSTVCPEPRAPRLCRSA